MNEAMMGNDHPPGPCANCSCEYYRGNERSSCQRVAVAKVTEENGDSRRLCKTHAMQWADDVRSGHPRGESS